MRGEQIRPAPFFIEQTLNIFFRHSIGPFAPIRRCPSLEIHKVFLRLVHLAS